MNTKLLHQLILSGLLTAAGTTIGTASLQAQTPEQQAEARPFDAKKPKFNGVARTAPIEWFATEEARAIADTVLAYQFHSGGWPKNHNWNRRPDSDEIVKREELRLAIMTHGVGPTIDNSATTSEIDYLCKVYSQQPDERYRNAALRGIRYLLKMQYSNGGWPQFYPPRPSGYDGVAPYSDHITFNDNAMVATMRVLWAIALDKAPYNELKLDADIRKSCQTAFDKGVQCILDCQIRKNGQLTVWCQQHDEVTLLPAAARAYELPSFTGSHETVEILYLLMDLPEPSEEVIKAVSSAIAWLEAHAIHDTKLESFINADNKKDRRLVHQEGAPLIWARYYDLETEKPFFCDRDGIKRWDLSEIGYERRTHYGWIGGNPRDAFVRYTRWYRNLSPSLQALCIATQAANAPLPEELETPAEAPANANNTSVNQSLEKADKEAKEKQEKADKEAKEKQEKADKEAKEKQEKADKEAKEKQEKADEKARKEAEKKAAAEKAIAEKKAKADEKADKAKAKADKLRAEAEKAMKEAEKLQEKADKKK